MLPLGHAAFAYLVYTGYTLIGTHRYPTNWSLLPLALGSQFPDLVDKPLVFVGVLASGRSLGHSVFALIVVISFGWWATKTVQKYRLATAWQHHLLTVTPSAFSIGYLSHVAGDLAETLLAGDYDEAQFILYPLYVFSSPADKIPPWIRLMRIYQHNEQHPQLELILLAFVVFIGVSIRKRHISATG